MFSLKANKLRKKKKEELSDPPYVPPEQEHKTRSKNQSNRKNPPEEMGIEDCVVGQVDVAEEEHVVVVSCTLSSDNLYDFMYCVKSCIIRICRKPFALPRSSTTRKERAVFR